MTHDDFQMSVAYSFMEQGAPPVRAPHSYPDGGHNDSRVAHRPRIVAWEHRVLHLVLCNGVFVTFARSKRIMYALDAKSVSTTAPTSLHTMRTIESMVFFMHRVWGSLEIIWIPLYGQNVEVLRPFRSLCLSVSPMYNLLYSHFSCAQHSIMERFLCTRILYAMNLTWICLCWIRVEVKVLLDSGAWYCKNRVQQHSGIRCYSLVLWFMGYSCC